MTHQNREGDSARYQGLPWLAWTGACLAVAILGIIVAPWPTPVPEVSLDAFDPRLITVDTRGFLARPGRVDVTAREVVLSTTSRSQPTVHVLTAEVPFAAAFSVSVLTRDGPTVHPLQVKVWNPVTEAAVEVWYAPDGSIVAGARTNERWWETRRLGAYRAGVTNDLRIVREDRRVVLEVSGDGQQASFEVDPTRFPALFEQETLSLTLYASAPEEGSSTAVVRNPRISVPRQFRYGTTVGSSWFRPIVGLAALFSLIWLAAWTRGSARWPRARGRDLVIILVLAGASLLAGWWLSRAPGHPFDIRTMVVWSGIAREHGPAGITGYSLVATEGAAHGGQPYNAVTYPYPPLLTYLFWLVGAIAPAGRFEQTFKMLTVIGVVAGGGVLFALLRHLRLSHAAAALVTGAYMLNPAILFDSAVWGQSDAFVGLFLLAAAAGIAVGSAPLLWTGALLAYLTKQTGGVFVPLLIAMGLARLGARQMTHGLHVAILIVFLMLTPAFLSGTHPSSVYRPVITKVLAFGTIRGMEIVNAVTSQGSFTLWSAAAALEDSRGWARLAFPDHVQSRVFGISYFTLSRIVFALFALLLLLLFLRRCRTAAPGIVFMVIAAYAAGTAILLTRVQPRYLYFGVMFAAASLPWMSRLLGGATLAVLTGTMLAGMWGLLVFTSVWYPGLLPVFEPERSWFNRVAAATLGSDIGITLGGLLNVGALAALLAAAWCAPNVDPLAGKKSTEP